MHAVTIPAGVKKLGSHENDGVSILVLGVNRASQIVGAWKDQGRDWRLLQLQGSPSDALYQGEPHVVISEEGVPTVLLKTETGEVFAHELEGFQKFSRPIPLQVKVGSKWSALRVSSGSMLGVVSIPKDPLHLGQGGDLDTDFYGLRALAQTSDGIVFFSVKQTAERWELRRENVGSEPDGSVSRYWSMTGRPSLHWTLPPSGQSGRGALQIYASTENNGGNPDSAPVLLRTRSVVDRLDASGSRIRWRIPHPSPLDNEWFYGAGVSALYDPTLDPEPRVAVLGFSGSHPRAEKNWSIQFRPHGGGLVDLTYRSANDWEALRVTPCELLQSTLDKKAVNCPKRKNN